MGAELAPPSMGLQGHQRDDQALRRGADSEGLDGGGLAVRA